MLIRLTRGFAIGGALLILATSSTLSQAADKIVIGLSMPFLSNGWQKAFLKSAQGAVSELNSSGKNVELKVVDAGSDLQTQIQQVNNLTIQHVDFLIIQPLSNTGLNGAIDNAMDAGIPVLSTVLGTVTNPRPIDMQFDYAKFASLYVDYLAKRIGGKGNALMIRGFPGAESDNAIMADYTKALVAYPDIKVVSEIYGEWNNSTTQQRISAVIPTLPKVDVVFDQSTGAYGAAEAFIAAGRDVPHEVFGFDGNDLKLLRELNEKSGYESVAIDNDPGIGSIAINVAVAQASGVKIPQKLVGPTPTITLDEIKTKYANLKESDYLTGQYTYDWTLQHIIGAK
jgi:ribose transport system substrate-binding protein